MIAGLGTDDLAVLWFDAHGEYMTPETTISGFLDGMGLAIMTGRCWKRLAATIPWFRPLPPSRTMLADSRDYSPGERDDLLNDAVPLVEPENLTEPNVARWLDAIRLEASRILVHVDLDVLDPRFGRANQYAADGGLSPDDILRMIVIFFSLDAAGPFQSREVEGDSPARKFDSGNCLADRSLSPETRRRTS